MLNQNYQHVLDITESCYNIQVERTTKKAEMLSQLTCPVWTWISLELSAFFRAWNNINSISYVIKLQTKINEASVSRKLKRKNWK